MVTGTSGQKVKGVAFTGNVFHGEGDTGTAISLTYVEGATLDNAYDGWSERFAITNCSEIKRGKSNVCSAYSAGGQNIAHGASAQVAFSGEFFEDIAGMHDNATNNNRFNNRFATRVRFSGWITIDNVKHAYGFVQKNGTGANLDSPFITSPAAADYPSVTLRWDTGWVEAAKTDWLSLSVYIEKQAMSGNATVTGGLAQFEIQG